MPGKEKIKYGDGIPQDAYNHNGGSLYLNRPYYLAGIVDWSGNGGGGLFCLFECRFGV